MKAPNHPASLSHRLILRLSVAIGIVSVIACAIFVLLFAKSERLALENDANLAVSHLATMLEKPLWDFDAERIQFIGETFTRDNRIASLTVLGDGGEKLYSFQREEGNGGVGRHAIVAHSGNKIGELDVAFTKRAYYVHSHPIGI